MAEQLEQMMRQLKLGGMAKEWRSVEYTGPEQYVEALLRLELKEREVKRINRMVKTAGFRVLKTLDEFIWKPDVELPAGLTREYMENLSFLPPKENLIFMHGENASGCGNCPEGLSGRAACPVFYRRFPGEHPAGKARQGYAEQLSCLAEKGGVDGG